MPLRLLSAHAFKALSNKAAPVVPEIAALARDSSHPQTADMALTALSYMGVPGASSLLAAASDPSHPFRNQATFRIGESSDLGPWQDVAVTNLLAALKDPAVNQNAGMALGNFTTRPEIIVPALAQCLENTNSAANLRAIAAISLLWFNENSAPALRALTNALTDPDLEVRRNATNTINHVNSRILHSEVSSRPYERSYGPRRRRGSTTGNQ
jgi:HEAT repeats